MMLDDFLQECGGVSYKALEKYADDPLPPLTVPLSLLSSKGSSPSGPKVAANAGGVRVEWYLGPDMSIKPEQLDKFEATGQYVIEPKWDGMWAMLTVGDPANGKPHLLKSRDAATGYVGGGNAGDLVITELPFAPGTILVGELEAATEASTKFFQSLHHRRLHLFDFPMGGYDHRTLPWTQRRALLEGAHHALSEHAKTRFPLVEAFTDKFRERYEAWIEAGGEGCVLKRKDSLYGTTRSDGKSDLWHRCKKTVTEDYVLCGIGKTAGGVPAGLWGLMINGKLKKVMQKGCPEHLLVPANIGKLVAEFMGWERFDSGALRHAQFVRVRDDKTPAMCVHEA
jgi:hypothetical protein